MSCLLLLVACFYSNARPYDDFLRDLDADADTGADTDTDTEADTDTDLPTPSFDQCSEPDGEGRTVLFTNQTGLPVDLFYVAPDCATVNVVLMANGDSSERFTYPGDVWRAWDAFGGTGWVDEVRVDATSTEIVLR